MYEYALGVLRVCSVLFCLVLFCCVAFGEQGTNNRRWLIESFFFLCLPFSYEKYLFFFLKSLIDQFGGGGGVVYLESIHFFGFCVLFFMTAI